MKNFFEIQKILNNKILKRNKHLDKIRKMSRCFNVPENIAICIYIIEAGCRPLWFRICENIFVIIGIIINIIFKKPLKNYTIGQYQTGIATILTYFNKPTYIHLKYIPIISLRDAINIIKAMYYITNYKVFFSELKKLYYSEIIRNTNQNNIICHIGEYYNGSITYGLMLEKLIRSITINKSQNEEIVNSSIINYNNKTYENSTIE